MNFPPQQPWKVGLAETETKMVITREGELKGLDQHWSKGTNFSQEEQDQESHLQYYGYQ